MSLRIYMLVLCCATHFFGIGQFNNLKFENLDTVDGLVVLLFKGRSYKEDGIKHSDMGIGVATAPKYNGEYTVVGDEPLFSMERFGEIEPPTFGVTMQGII
ncbi:hypothetical protein [Maribacter polysiphoniae]|uniref:hypothetical protein n=1 Tax=Maribacter polysiphoniae TaxID=429344 RepID=UPI0023529B4B|nr:hypothetical protein [Maribacter polysiphoniae]